MFKSASVIGNEITDVAKANISKIVIVFFVFNKFSFPSLIIHSKCMAIVSALDLFKIFRNNGKLVKNYMEKL